MFSIETFFSAVSAKFHRKTVIPEENSTEKEKFLLSTTKKFLLSTLKKSFY